VAPSPPVVRQGDGAGQVKECQREKEGEREREDSKKQRREGGLRKSEWK